MTTKGTTAKADLTPAVADHTPVLPTDDPWKELRDEFDDGSELFKQVFGLTLPRLKSDFGRNGKGWVDSLTGEARNRLVLCILAYPPTRAWWEKSLDESGGEVTQPDCRSVDMIVPTASSPQPQSEKCATCPHSQWGSDRKGGRGKDCGEAANVLAYDFEGDQTVWVQFGSTALTPFKKYVSALAARRLPTFAVLTQVTLHEVKEGNLVWLVPDFSIMVDEETGEHAILTPEQVKPLRDIAKNAMADWRTVGEEMAAVQRDEVNFSDPEPFADPDTGEVGQYDQSEAF